VSRGSTSSLLPHDLLQIPHSVTSVESVRGELIFEIRKIRHTVARISWFDLKPMKLMDDMPVSIAELSQDVGSIVQIKSDLPNFIHKGKVDGYVRVEVGTALPAGRWGHRRPVPGSGVIEFLCITRMVKDFDEALEFNTLVKIRGWSISFVVGVEVSGIELQVALILATSIAVLAIVVPEKRLTLDTKASATAFLPVSQAASDDLLAANKAEMGGTRWVADHVVATLPLEDLFLATGTLLVVLPFAHLLERVFLHHLLTMMSLRAAARPALPASRAMTHRAANRPESPGPQIRAANIPVNAAALLAVHAGLHRHVIILQLLRPRGQKISIEQVPECPDVENNFPKHHWVVVLVLEGLVEARRHTFLGAFVADPAVVVDPARQRFELAVAADHAFEVGFRHGGLLYLLVGVSNSVEVRGW
jgi:hypothetical protein